MWFQEVSAKPELLQRTGEDTAPGVLGRLSKDSLPQSTFSLLDIALDKVPPLGMGRGNSKQTVLLYLSQNGKEQRLKINNQTD